MQKQNITLMDVLNTIVHYMDPDSARRMAGDCSQGPQYMSACDKAYALYMQIREGVIRENECIVW